MALIVSILPHTKITKQIIKKLSCILGRLEKSTKGVKYLIGAYHQITRNTYDDVLD